MLSIDEQEALRIAINMGNNNLNVHICALDPIKDDPKSKELYKYFLGLKVNLTSAGIKLGILEAKTTMHSYERRSKKNP